jgi:hypothetical protein
MSDKLIVNMCLNCKHRKVGGEFGIDKVGCMKFGSTGIANFDLKCSSYIQMNIFQKAWKKFSYDENEVSW